MLHDKPVPKSAHNNSLRREGLGLPHSTGSWQVLSKWSLASQIVARATRRGRLSSRNLVNACTANPARGRVFIAPLADLWTVDGLWGRIGSIAVWQSQKWLKTDQAGAHSNVESCRGAFSTSAPIVPAVTHICRGSIDSVKSAIPWPGSILMVFNSRNG